MEVMITLCFNGVAVWEKMILCTPRRGKCGVQIEDTGERVILRWS